MNWKIALKCVHDISGMKQDAAKSMVLLRQEIVGSSQLSAVEKSDLHEVMDGLQQANLYGRISFLSRLKELLSRHAEFKAGMAEFSLRRD